jgi:hypothetical protein
MHCHHKFGPANRTRKTALLRHAACSKIILNSWQYGGVKSVEQDLSGVKK